MSISLYSQDQYPVYQQQNILDRSVLSFGGGNRNRAIMSNTASTGRVFQSAGDTAEDKPEKTKEMRRLLRQLSQLPQKKENPFAATSEDRINGFMETQDASEDEEEEDKNLNYNCKEVETKIRQAKTSVSAGKAVISAKRKVLELKRKISCGNCDPDEVQAALTHARRMEMVARKKKHHLELEELAKVTGERDERADKQKETADDIKNAAVTIEKDKIAKQEDEILEERQEQLSEAMEAMKENASKITKEQLKEFNKMLSQFGEKQLRELEEAMAMLEDLEMIDPHMSKEDLEKLKKKHRAEEQKAMVKADMDYLKSMIKHQTQSSPYSSGSGSFAGGSMVPAFSLSSGITEPFSGGGMAAGGFSEGASIDVHV